MRKMIIGCLVVLFCCLRSEAMTQRIPSQDMDLMAAQLYSQGLSPTEVNQILKDMGYPVRTRSPSPVRGAAAARPRTPSPQPHQDMDAMAAQLYSQGLSSKEVNQILKDMGYPVRERSPSPRGAAAARPRTPSPVRAERTLTQAKADWLQRTPLIGAGSPTIAGFGDNVDPLHIFNPLYNQSYPNVPVIHQYNPQVSTHGGNFPLVVRIPGTLRAALPPRIKEVFHTDSAPNLEIYWVIYNQTGLKGTGGGDADNIIFRPQYWVQPSGNNIGFSIPAQLLDHTGAHYNLPSVGYSIHDGDPGNPAITIRRICSPNAPLIPFHAALQEDNSKPFWSFVQHEGRSAVTYTWVLYGDDTTYLNQVKQDSATLLHLLGNLQRYKERFSQPTQKMIEEINEILGRR